MKTWNVNIEMLHAVMMLLIIMSNLKGELFGVKVLSNEAKSSSASSTFAIPFHLLSRGLSFCSHLCIFEILTGGD